jgi:hypothetical protein
LFVCFSQEHFRPNSQSLCWLPVLRYLWSEKIISYSKGVFDPCMRRTSFFLNEIDQFLSSKKPGHRSLKIYHWRRKKLMIMTSVFMKIAKLLIENCQITENSDHNIAPLLSRRYCLLKEHACTYVHLYVYMYICMDICMYICTYVCTYICRSTLNLKATPTLLEFRAALFQARWPDWANFRQLVNCFTLGSFHENYTSSEKFWGYFNVVNYYWQKWVGLDFGRFFTNSSGYPGSKIDAACQITVHNYILILHRYFKITTLKLSQPSASRGWEVKATPHWVKMTFITVHTVVCTYGSSGDCFNNNLIENILMKLFFVDRSLSKCLRLSKQRSNNIHDQKNSAFRRGQYYDLNFWKAKL